MRLLKKSIRIKLSDSYNYYNINIYEAKAMNERELDSSVNEYEEQYKSNNYIKQLQWDMAIGLQRVNNLKPSKYLEKLLEEEVEGNLTIED